MLIIADSRISNQAKLKLESIGDLCLFKSNDIVYNAISGHPDIFIFQIENNLIIAPQTPEYIILKLQEYYIDFTIGNSNLGKKHPETTAYNVAYADDLFIGNKKTTDKSIIELSKSSKWIQTPQSYSRCNTVILNKDNIITSDINISRAVPSSLFINPKQILLEPFKHGFFGGCTGIYENNIVINGSLKYHSQKEDIEMYCNNADYNIIELYDGPLVDIGSIIFLL